MFVMTGKMAAAGNIMSLIDGLEDGTKIIPNNYCFFSLFLNCKSLITAPALPTTVKSYCYYKLFMNCTSLTTAPTILLATTLAPYCYRYMFNGCTSLTTAPALPATTLQNNCYSSMFAGCTNLNYVKCYATTNINTTNLSSWLKDVSSTGNFYKDSNTTYSEGISGIPSGWTTYSIES